MYFDLPVHMGMGNCRQCYLQVSLILVPLMWFGKFFFIPGCKRYYQTASLTSNRLTYFQCYAVAILSCSCLVSFGWIVVCREVIRSFVNTRTAGLNLEFYRDLIFDRRFASSSPSNRSLYTVFVSARLIYFDVAARFRQGQERFGM